ERCYERLDARVAGSRHSIDPDKSRPFEGTNVVKNAPPGRQICEQANVRLDDVQRHRLRERRDDTDSTLRRPSSGLLNRAADGLRPHGDLRLVRCWTGDGQHQRSGVPEVTLKIDGAGALWKPAAERVQFEVDVGELLL